MLAGICGAFLTGDIFNMYVWFEVMLIASFGLLVIGGGRDELDGAMKYVGLNLIATVAFISGVGLLYGATGALNMADLHGRLAGRVAETPILASAAFLIFAFASKAALFPLFFWLPASYHTPSFTTSALFAALLTKVGVYALIRVFTLVYPRRRAPRSRPCSSGARSLTMVVGVLGALAMTGVRRVLGFSIISSIGYMILGLAVATPLALVGAVFYLVPGRGGEGEPLPRRRRGPPADRLRALRPRRAASGGSGPGSRSSSSIPALSLAGVPPFSGFWAKLLLAKATLDAGRYGLTFAVLGGRPAHALRHGADLVGGLLGRPSRRRPTPSPSGCRAAMLAPLARPDRPRRLRRRQRRRPSSTRRWRSAAEIVDPAAYIAAVLGPRP